VALSASAVTATGVAARVAPVKRSSTNAPWCTVVTALLNTTEIVMAALVATAAVQITAGELAPGVPTLARWVQTSPPPEMALGIALELLDVALTTSSSPTAGVKLAEVTVVLPLATRLSDCASRVPTRPAPPPPEVGVPVVRWRATTPSVRAAVIQDHPRRPTR
jgi:hypothetical protein